MMSGSAPERDAPLLSTKGSHLFGSRCHCVEALVIMSQEPLLGVDTRGQGTATTGIVE